MKHVVVAGDLRGSDIRPPALLERFRSVSMRESERIFGDRGRWVSVSCPACGSERSSQGFRRDDFVYRDCEECGTLYVSPRPTKEALHEYFTDSEAARFRTDYFGRLTGGARTELILESRARWITRLWDEAGPRGAYDYVDVGTTYPGLLDQLEALDVFESICTFRPGVGVDLHDVEHADAAPQQVGAVGLFEQLEHQYDPMRTLQEAGEMLVDGGLLFLTTRSSSGFDIKVLAGEAAYIFVPEHLNLISVEGAEIMMDRLKMESVELSTPGQLDVDLVRSNIQDASELPPFVRYLLEHRGHETLEDFQIFLQKNRLSSHLRIAAKKE